MPADHPNLRLLSTVLGWVYFTSWTTSFYPQVLLNHKTKSTHGFSSDFATMNPLGYLSLTIFNVSLRFSPFVRTQYARRNGGHRPTVAFEDVVFAVHALALSAFAFGQTVYYPSTQRLSTFNRLVLPILALILLTGGALTHFGAFEYELLDFLYLFSYIKLLITFTKYIPQAHLNYTRKSTEGWSIINIYLDLTGGLLSLIQLFLDAWLEGDLKGGTIGNPSKLGMALFSAGFDLLFMVQHYVLYPHPEEGVAGDEEDEAAKKLRRERLVEGGEEEEGEVVVDERTPLV